MPDLNRGDIPHWYDPSAYDRRVEDTCEGYGPAPDEHVHSRTTCRADVEGPSIWWLCGHDPMFTPRVPPEDTCEGYGPRPCSMCGASTHSERERTDDGEWDEDCVFHPFFDGDGNDLRRPGQAGRPR